MKPETGVALVTGASSGIGREFARLLAAEGRPLLLVGRDQGRLNEVAEEARTTHGVAVWAHPCDLGRPGAARELFDFTRGEGLEIEFLINNAGFGLYGEHVDLDLTRLHQMLQVNVGALAELCLLCGAEMKRRKSGRILNVASTAAYQPTPYLAAYGASKSFVLSFSEALAMELADHGVTVSCVSPGPTDTAFFGDMEARGAASGHFAKSRRQDAREVARIGLDAMMTGRLSKVVGAKNAFLAWSNRLAPRKLVAKVSKGLMRSSAGSS
jgi:short-subunit dehydrogenase